MSLIQQLIPMLQSRASRRADARKRRAAKPKVPSATERAYRMSLNKRVKVTHDRMMKLLESLLKSREREEARGDSRLDASEQLELFLKLITKAESDAKAKQKVSEEALAKTAGSVDRFTTGQMAPTFAAAPKAVGVSLRAPATATRGKWVKANVKLIKSIDSRYFDDIRKIVREGLESGRNTAAIRRDLQRRFQVSKARADLIARDQISKLNGEITKAKQKKAGIKEYEWSTSGDERVRESHQANDGKIFKWSDPPATGHPGEDFQCRCVALPVFPDE